jgi:glutamine phosphoribosylpyrophosphate amidotransferase
VRRTREVLSEKLADFFTPDDADYVTFLPDSPDIAARKYVEKTGIPLLEAMYKKKGERSFQGTTTDDRVFSINQNLHIYPHALERLENAIIVNIDDSNVRGTNLIRALTLYAKVGVRKVYHLTYSPPIGIIGEDGEKRGCLFGIDMPPNDSFIVREKIGDTVNPGEVVQERNRKPEEINEYVTNEVRRLSGNEKFEAVIVYLPVEEMLRGYESLGWSRTKLCTHCIGGKHPFTNLTVNGK